jgi:Uma2 family endonuclease
LQEEKVVYDEESEGYAETKHHNLKKIFMKIVNELHTSSREVVFPFEVDSNVSAETYDRLCDSLEADGVKRGCKTALLDGRLVILEIPGSPHEVTVDLIRALMTESCIQMTGNCTDPLKGRGSTRVRYGEATSMEGDATYRNHRLPLDQCPRDANGELIPFLVFEVASSESYERMATTPNHYLANEHVRLVISIKLVLSNPLHVHQLYCIIHERCPNGRPIVSRVISFGPRMHRQAEAAILRHTHIEDGNFVGIGRTHFPTPANYLDTLRDPIFAVTLPHDLVWQGVPQEEVLLQQISLSLREIVLGLVDDDLLEL